MWTIFCKKKHEISHQISLQTFLFTLQRHQFESKFDPTHGYLVKLKEVTDGGLYTCHAKFDAAQEFDIHFHIEIDCELKKCNTTIENEMPATPVVAPNSINQITTISKSHLTNVTTASKTMVNRTGDGQSSFQKRHISFDTSTASVQSSSSPVLQTNQHLNMYDIELTTTTEYSITTVRPKEDEIHTIGSKFRKSSNHLVAPTSSYGKLEKRRG